MRLINRRTKRVIKKYYFLGIIFVIILSVCIMSTGYSLLKRSLNISGNSSIILDSHDSDDASEKCGLSYSYTISAQWDDWGQEIESVNYIINGQIDNIGSKNITGWEVKIPHASIFTLNEGNYELKVKNDSYILSNLTWNGNINPNGSVALQFGMKIPKSENLESVIDHVVIYSCKTSSGNISGGDTPGGDNPGGDNPGGDTPGGGNKTETITEGNLTVELNNQEFRMPSSIKVISVNENYGGYTRLRISITNNSDQDITSWRGILNFGNNIAIRDMENCTYNIDWTNRNIEIKNVSGTSIKAGETLEVDLTVWGDASNWSPDMIFVGLKDN